VSPEFLSIKPKLTKKKLRSSKLPDALMIYFENRKHINWKNGMRVMMHSRIIDQNKLASIASMLGDTDAGIRRQGSFMFSLLGKEAYEIVDIALKYRHDPDYRFRSYVLDGVISCTKFLKSDQISLALDLADDPEDLVREKVIALIGALDVPTIQSSIGLLESQLQDKYMEALNDGEKDAKDVQSCFDNNISTAGIKSTFALASLQRMARLGLLTFAPNYNGDLYLARTVLANIQRLIKRKLRNSNRVPAS